MILWEVEDTDIELTRGDDFMLGITAIGRTVADGSVGTISIKKKKDDAEVLLTKTGSFSSNKVSITFTDEDTKDLAAGKYRYAFRVTDTEGLIYTAVENAVFRIKEVIA